MKKLLLSTLLCSAFFQSQIAFSDGSSTPYDTQLNYKKYYKAKKTSQVSSIKPKNASTNSVVVNEFLLKSVKINNQTLSKYDDSYISYIGKRINNKSAQTIIDNINKNLQDQGKLLSFAYISSQDLRTGTLNIKIIDGKIRDIKIVSDFRVDQNKLFKDYVEHILNLQPVYNLELQKNIQLISRIPGYEVQYRLEEVTDPQADIDEVADLILTIGKRRADINLVANNQGVSALGKYQFSALGNFYNAFGTNEEISLYGGTSNKPNKLKTAVLDITKTINSYGTSINLLGSYIEDNPSTLLVGSSNSNKANQLQLSLDHYFILTSKYTLEGVIGVEHGKDNDFIPGSKVSTMRYTDAYIGGNIEFRDFINGQNYVTPYFYQSIPGMTKINRFNSSAQLLDRNYKFVTLDMYRTQNLSKDFSIFTQILTQYSNNNLPIDQTFFIGGLTGGRAYKLGTASSNKGIDFAAEFRYTKDLDNQAVSEVEPYLFYDVVKFSKSYALTNVSTLQSAGAGIRAKFKYDFYGNFETGVPFTRYLTVGGIRQHNPTRYSFILSKAFSF